MINVNSYDLHCYMSFTLLDVDGKIRHNYIFNLLLFGTRFLEYIDSKISISSK